MNSSPRPLDGQVHIYCISMPQHHLELVRLGCLLSPEETGRRDALKSGPAKNRFITSRGVLREILGSYLGIEPEKVPLKTGKHGKPFLTGDGVDLDFNLSHAGDLLMLAIAAGQHVGIDIEKIETDKALNGMARIAFSQREQEELAGLPSLRQQALAFYRCWVRKEACLKASGTGFQLPGSSFNVTPLNQEMKLMTTCCSQTCWHVMDIPVHPDYCAAVAVEIHSSSQPPPVLLRMEADADYRLYRKGCL